MPLNRLMRCVLALFLLPSCASADDVAKERWVAQLRGEFAQYAFNPALPEGIYRRSPYANDATFLPGFALASGGYPKPVPGISMDLRRPKAILSYRWTGTCSSYAADHISQYSLRGFQDLLDDRIFKIGVDPIPASDIKSSSFYASWLLGFSGWRDLPSNQSTLRHWGVSIRGPSVIPITIACGVVAYREAVAAERALKPDYVLERAWEGCAVTLTMEPGNRFAIRGGGIVLLSRRQGKLDTDDPDAVACLARGLMIHKGAVGAWNVAAGALFRSWQERRFVGTPGGAIMDRLMESARGYQMLMYAPFGPGTSRAEALKRLDEIQNPDRCYLVADPFAHNGRRLEFGMPFVDNYKPSNGAC
jgi:hypothetical protein